MMTGAEASSCQDSKPGDEAAVPGNKVDLNQPWHRPPTITPNFGRAKKIGPKSNLTQVLLHDNVSQDQILRSQIQLLEAEEKKSGKLLDLHKKSFLVQQSHKQHQLRKIGVMHLSFLPDDIAEAHCAMLRYSRRQQESKSKSAGPKDDRPPTKQRARPQAKSALPALEIHQVTSSEEGGNARTGNPKDAPNGNLASGSSKSRYYVPGDADDRTSLVTRSTTQSAAPKTFMTHNYHLRREKTSLLHRGRSPLRGPRDPRYLSLRRSLVPCESSVDGYLQLSPSGQYVLQKYGTPHVNQLHVSQLIRELSLYRPCSTKSKLINSSRVGTAHAGSNSPIADTRMKKQVTINDNSSDVDNFE